MTIDDRVYGSVEITEPVLLELIAAPSFQRLKTIDQFGLSKRFSVVPSYDRFEHCVGVMLLLRRVGASLEEQVAGLLHDVSHTAFSHLIDWIIGDAPEREAFQDENHERFIVQSELPIILQRHGLSPERITDYERFGLLERPAPELCADRVDYSVREFAIWADLLFVPLFLENLVVKDGRMICATREIAARLGKDFLTLQFKHWAHEKTLIRYYLLAKIFRLALDRGVLHLKDFTNGSDEEIFAKIETSSDVEIRHQLHELPKMLAEPASFSQSEVTVRKKFRWIDPLFEDGKTLRHLSDVDAEFKETINREQEKSTHGVVIRVPNF